MILKSKNKIGARINAEALNIYNSDRIDYKLLSESFTGIIVARKGKEKNLRISLENTI